MPAQSASFTDMKHCIRTARRFRSKYGEALFCLKLGEAELNSISLFFSKLRTEDVGQ